MENYSSDKCCEREVRGHLANYIVKKFLEKMMLELKEW